MKHFDKHVLSLKHVASVFLGCCLVLALLALMFGKGLSVSAMSQDLFSTNALEPLDTPITPRVQTPQNLTAHAAACGTGMLYLTWNASSGALAYRVTRNGSTIYESLTLSYLDTGLSPGQTYEYTVSAIRLGTVSESAVLQVTAPPACSTATPQTTIQSGSSASAPGTGQTVTAPVVNTVTQTNPSGTEPVDTVVPAPKTNVTPSPSTEVHITPTAPHAGLTTTVTPPQAVAIPVSQIPLITTATTKSVERELIDTEKVARPAIGGERQVQFTSVVAAFNSAKSAAASAKNELVSVVDARIAVVLAGESGTALETKKASFQKIKDQLTSTIGDRLDGATTVTPAVADELKVQVITALDKIGTPKGTSPDVATQQSVENAIATLAGTVESSSAILKQQGGDALFKDTNKDGISDYESKAVYNIDPSKPVTLTDYNGKKITPGDKILLGFDPSKPGLVPVTPEEPTLSSAPLTPAYKIEGVSLTSDKKVSFSGSALPNSYVTLYIYSTPIIVTIKTDANGDWRYTLDKEIEDGTHTITTATVNNSGKILAKSSGFAFTKTAQAATLASAIPTSASDAGPRVFELNNFNILLGAVAGIFIFALFLIGLGARNRPTFPSDIDYQVPPLP